MRIDWMASKVAFIAAAVACGVWLSPGTASAQVELKQDQVGAAIAFPLLTGSGRATYITLTNVGSSDRNLHFNMISGKDWGVTDFDCPVTASETVLITYREEPIPRLTLECNFGGANPIRVVSRATSWSEGVLFVALETHECKDGSCTSLANDLFGDFVVINAASGSAFSAGGIPFQGQDPLADGASDRDYHFDNEEYSMFPATLAANFIAPGAQLVGGFVDAEVILFTLDGRANIGSQAALDIVIYDDDETPTSAHYSLDCYARVRLVDINPNFGIIGLGSEAGHFYMTVIDADQYSNVHDNKFGNGNSIRIVGVHGWLVQTMIIPGSDGPPRFAQWARSLSQGMLPQDLDNSDKPTLDSF